MPSLLTRLLLFLSSYFPLAVILAILFFEKNVWLAVAFLVAGSIGVIGLMIYLSIAQRISPIQVTVKGYQRKDSEAMSYILSYLIPFVVTPSDEWHKAVSLGLFFVVLGLVYVNTNMTHVNPMLNIFGYRIYEASLEDGSIHALITKRRIKRGHTVSVIEVDDDVLLEKNDGKTKKPSKPESPSSA